MGSKIKKTRTRIKIVSATATAIFSLASVFTATYAWFAANGSVNATGMQVSVRASGGCTIQSIRLVKFDYEKIALSPTSTIYNYLEPEKGKVSSYVFNESENNTFGYYDESEETPRWVPVSAMNAYDPYEKIIKGAGFNLASMNSNAVYEVTFSNPTSDFLLTLQSTLQGLTANANNREMLLSSCADIDVFYKDDLNVPNNSFVGINVCDFSAERNYEKGAYVLYSGVLYKCIADFTANETDPTEDSTHWGTITYNSASAYSLGDYVVDNGVTYQCIEDINANAENAPGSDITHWMQVSYAAGDVVLYNNHFYKCKNTVSSNWIINSTNWDEISEYTSSYGYALNDVVLYSNKLYKNITPIGRAWNSENWKPVINFSSSTSYAIGEHTIYSGAYYKCIKAITASSDNQNQNNPSADDEHWINIAYQSGADYRVGDYAVYSNTIYRCVEAVTNSGASPSNSKWEAVGDYSNNGAYITNQLIYYNSSLYSCVSGNKEEFNPSHWELLTTYSTSAKYHHNSVTVYEGDLYRRDALTAAVDGAFTQAKWNQMLYNGYYYPTYKTFDAEHPASSDEELYYGVSYLAIQKNHKHFYNQASSTINLNDAPTIRVPRSDENFVVYINVNYNPEQLDDYYTKINTTDDVYTAINDLIFDFDFSDISAE